MADIFFDESFYPEESLALRSLDTLSAARVLGIDLASPADGLAALISARRSGITTAVFPILPDPFENTLALIGQSISSTSNGDQRAQQIAALRADQLQVNGHKPSQLASIAQQAINAAALALRLADIVLLASPGERDRWSALLSRPCRRTLLLPVAEATEFRTLDERGITIFAPNTDEAFLAHYVLLLRNHFIDPQIISANNPQDEITSRVVVTPEWRPMRTRALSARGHSVVAPSMTRVDECDSRIFGYLPADYRSFISAVDAARSAGRGAQRIAIGTSHTSTSIADETASYLDGPMVSIVIRTYDRPALLRRAIASVAAQTYRSVEIIVVNNGGNDVGELVESASGGRPYKYVVMPERKHISAASNIGARAAGGKYVGYLDDDDLLYADHCSRTVEVLERSEVDVVFTLCLAEYSKMHGDDKEVLGYQIYLDRDFNLDDIHVSNLTPIHSIVHRRDVFDRFGYFDEELPVTDDWEFWLRIASRGGTFLRIDRATCEYSWRYDPERGNMTVQHQWDFVHAYRKITERYAAGIHGRASLKAAQANMLVEQERRALAAADPANRASIVIGSMSASVVPVAPVQSTMSFSPGRLK